MGVATCLSVSTNSFASDTAYFSSSFGFLYSFIPIATTYIDGFLIAFARDTIL